MSSITIASLEASTAKLFNDLREYVRSQKSVWQKLPWLALQEYGRCVLVESDPIVWEKGYWPIDTYNADNTVALVDLATGELVDVGPDGGTPTAQQMLIILGHLRRVDATYIRNGLDEGARQKYPALVDPANMEKWKKGVQARYNIKKTYVRK